MAKVLKVVAVEDPFAEAYATVALGGIPEVYVQFRAALTASIIDEVAADNDAYCSVTSVLGSPGREGILYGDGVNEWAIFSNQPLGAGAADEWVTWDLHLTQDAPGFVLVVVRRNEVEVFNGTGFNATTDFDTLEFGAVDFFSPDEDSVYTFYLDDLKVGTTGYGSTDIFSEDFEGADPLANFAATFGDLEVIDDPFTPTSGVRFFQGFPWRVLVTDLDSISETLLDRLASPIVLDKVRNAPAEIQVGVPSDNPQVNILADDGDPFVAEGNRLVWLFRREGGSPPWKIRGSGIALDVNDEGGPVTADSTLRAFDSWKYLYRRLVITDDAGTLPLPNGLNYPAGTRGSDIIVEQLERTVAAFGTVRLDWGQTGFYEGVIENTDPLPDEGDGVAMNVQRGASIGELFDQLVETGTLDIVIVPIYDPVNRPGILGELSVYITAGSRRNAASFGWDRWPKNVPRVGRRVDGTARANWVKFFAGQGGIPTATQESAASQARYGVYQQAQFFPGRVALGDATTAAERQLATVKNGETFYSFDPSTDRAPIPLIEYDIHDEVPTYASKRLRAAIADVVLVERLRLEVNEVSMEQATLEVSNVDEDGS